MVRISFLVYCFSRRIEMTHSFTFCTSLLTMLLEACLVKSILASCWVMVLAPPSLPSLTAALAVPLKSMPECS